LFPLSSKLPVPGGRIVNPLGFLFGGFGGTMKDGEEGAVIGKEQSPNAAVLIFRAGGGGVFLVGATMFNERFFVLRAFLPGESGRLYPGGGLVGEHIDRSSVDEIPHLLEEKDESGSIEIGDSGDEPGDVSAMEDESTVEIVVVGEESAEAEVEVEVLS
jgi:hypothetical protein